MSVLSPTVVRIISSISPPDVAGKSDAASSKTPEIPAMISPIAANSVDPSNIETPTASTPVFLPKIDPSTVDAFEEEEEEDQVNENNDINEDNEVGSEYNASNNDSC